MVENIQIVLKNLGNRLLEVRLSRNDTQEDFAARIGTSVSTLKRMEKGDASVAIGKWVNVLAVLDRTDELNFLLQPNKSRLENAFLPLAKKRKRASGA